MKQMYGLAHVSQLSDMAIFTRGAQIVAASRTFSLLDRYIRAPY